jgi:FkbM family methyltransferase
MKNLLSTLKHWRFRLFYLLFLRKNIPLEEFGEGLTWIINPEGLNKDSIIYSAGAGRDISFEQALVKRFGCKVYLYDPSPTARETMDAQKERLQGIIFQPTGLAAESRDFTFSSPVNPQEGSFTIQREGTKTITLPCSTIQALMERNGHDHIDLLKMDIEGFEYAVIDQLLRQRLPVRQICVEYHHWTGLFSRWDTIRSVVRLHFAGYRLLHEEGWNHTFKKR